MCPGSQVQGPDVWVRSPGWRESLVSGVLEFASSYVYMILRLRNWCLQGSFSGTHFSKALFVPSMSTYNRVTSAASAILANSFNRDLTWQFELQRLWEKLIHGKGIYIYFLENSNFVLIGCLPCCLLLRRQELINKEFQYTHLQIHILESWPLRMAVSPWLLCEVQ